MPFTHEEIQAGDFTLLAERLQQCSRDIEGLRQTIGRSDANTREMVSRLDQSISRLDADVRKVSEQIVRHEEQRAASREAKIPDRVENLEKAWANIQGRMWGIGATIGIVFTLIQLAIKYLGK